VTRFLCRTLALVVALCATHFVQAASPERLNYQQAQKSLSHPEPQRRINGLQRLLKLGTAKDAGLVYPLLGDAELAVRQAALATVWQLWGKSGDASIDKLYGEGLVLMQSGDTPKAIQVFGAIIAKRPDFAEAWNKRATIYYMTGEYDLSLRDCEEVLKRVPQHFGALVGYAQMLSERSQPERALELMERASQVNPYLANADLMMGALRVQIETNRKNLL
jgi:tetratricopeptide (TPR) repeat protein